MTARVPLDVAGIVSIVLAATLIVGGVGVAPVAGAATGVTDGSVSPATVDTGVATTLTFEANVTGVDTSDGTTDSRVAIQVSDAVDLSNAGVTDVTVGPNTTGVDGAVDAAGTVTVTWNDSAGVASETLSVSVTVDGVVVDRTGTSDVTTAVDADADATDEVTATIGTITASAATSDRSVDTTDPTLYLGERAVDVTGLAEANPAGESQQFYGVSGDADGSVARTDDTRTVDVTAANGFVPGAYNFSSADGTTAIAVVRPRVTDVAVYTGTTTGGTDVTNQSVPQGTETLTVEPQFTFDRSEGVTVSVVDDEGLDVTPQLTASPTVTASGETVTLNVSDLAVGTYTVTVEGADDLDETTETVSFRIRDPARAVTLSKTRVVRGENTIASVAGAPGEVWYLRIATSDLPSGTLANTATARDIFDETEQVQSVGANSEYVYAVVALDSDGLSEARIRTARLVTGAVDVEVAPELDAQSEDEVTLHVAERTVTVSSPGAVTIGETVTVSGTAPESEQVKLYAAVDETYVPLYEDAADDALAEPKVRSDGTWQTDVDTSAVVDLAGAYRLVAVGDPGQSRLGSTAPVDEDVVRSLEPRAATTVRTVEGGLSLAASRTTIAATGSDEFDLSGTALGQGDTLRLYRVGPRGTVEGRTVDVADDDTFAETVDGLDRRGVHRFVVVAPGRDGTFDYADGSGPAVDGLVSGAETQSAAVAKIVDAYTEAGSDDPLARVGVRAATPSVSVSTPGDDGSFSPDVVVVSGQSNAEDGAVVFVELLGDAGVVTSTEASVTNGTWNATLNLTTVPSGTYRLAVETVSASESVEVTVGSATTARSTTDEAGSVEAETTPGDATADSTATQTSSGVTERPGSASSSTAGTTATAAPGFGVVVALVSLVIVGARRRRQSRR